LENVEGAISHINKYNSKHTEAILTNNKKQCQGKIKAKTKAIKAQMCGTLSQEALRIRTPRSSV
jgi:gamma-glutamyl phosphate reductase